MAIPTPQFQVPILSPAALLRDQDDDSPFDEALDRGMDFFFRSQLQEQAIDSALERTLLSQEGTTERNIQTLEGRGFIQEVPEEGPPSVTFPGDDVPREVPTFEAAGREFFSVPVAQAMQETARARTPLGPKEGFRPGTVQGQIQGDDVSDEDVARRQLAPAGTVQALQDIVSSIPAGPRFEGFRRSAQSLLNAAMSDDYLTRQEFESLEESGLTLDTLDQFQERQMEIQAMSEERREAINKETQKVMEKYRVRALDQEGNVIPGEFNPLTIVDANKVAVWRVAPEILPAETEREIASFVGNRVRINPEVPDLYDDINRRFVAMSNTEAPEHHGAALTVQMWAQQSDELADRIINDPAGGSLQIPDIRRLLSSSSPLGEGLRAAVTMQTRSKSEILNLEANQQVFPFGLRGENGLFEISEIARGAEFNDSPDTGGTGSVGVDATYTEEEVEALLTNFEESGHLSSFENMISQMTPGGRQAMRLALQGESWRDLAGQLQQAATRREVGGNENEAEMFRQLAQWVTKDKTGFTVINQTFLLPALAAASGN